MEQPVRKIHTAVVTGPTGAIGHALCARLLGAGIVTNAAAQTAVLKDYKTGSQIPYGGKQQAGAIQVPVKFSARQPMFRGVWVATVENIDFPKHAAAGEFINDYKQVMNNLKRLHFNAVLFQVRANNDAFYPSSLNPWSRWLTGKEGVGIKDFDPLKYMVSEAHNSGMEFHAWLNPYRVTNSTSMRKDEYLKTLDAKNFARLHPEYVLEIPLEGGKYQLILNPGEPEVINFVVKTVMEIVRNYQVDAIHFDDYFYPYGDMGKVDEATFNKYHKSIASIDNWRRNNVDTLIKNIRTALDEFNRKNNRKVQFGISPFGIWANSKNNPLGSLSAGSQSYYRQYADTRGWVKRRWVDYIVPQLYWPFAHDAAPYAALADWWAQQVRGTGVNLYIGMGAYRMGSGGAWNNPDELAAELRYNNARANIKGEIFFSYRSVFEPKNEIMKKGVSGVLADYWKFSVPTPAPMNRSAGK